MSQDKYKFATPITILFILIAFAGIAYSFFLEENELLIVFSIIPALLYAIYLENGISSRIISLLILALVLTEIYLLIENVNVNLTGYVAEGKKIFYKNKDNINTLKQYSSQGNLSLSMLFNVLSKIKIPWQAFIQLKLVVPLIQLLAAFFLYRKASSSHTKWLSIAILLSSIAVAYILLPDIVSNLIKDVTR